MLSVKFEPVLSVKRAQTDVMSGLPMGPQGFESTQGAETLA